MTSELISDFKNVLSDSWRAFLSRSLHFVHFTRLSASRTQPAPHAHSPVPAPPCPLRMHACSAVLFPVLNAIHSPCGELFRSTVLCLPLKYPTPPQPPRSFKALPPRPQHLMYSLVIIHSTDVWEALNQAFCVSLD